MAPAEQLQQWRAELVMEQAELEAELATARNELPGVEAKYAEIVRQSSELQLVTTRGLNHQESMAGVLYARLETARRDALRSASSARGALTARIRTLQERIAGRQLAIQQLDRALDPAKVTPFRSVTESSYRKPKPLDYETITMRSNS